MIDFAPEDPDFYLADLYPALHRLRREDPVHCYGKAACWCITKHANRDEEVWGENTACFDIRRDHSRRRHLSFEFGEHLCLGAPLARLEARVMFEELLARLPEFEPAGPLERQRSRLMNGIERMPVVFKA